MNKIAEIYGIELGCFSRIRLLRMVIGQYRFCWGNLGVAQDIGMEWLSRCDSKIVCGVSLWRIGVGLLTARLGVRKLMELCRPLAFQSKRKTKTVVGYSTGIVLWIPCLR